MNDRLSEWKTWQRSNLWLFAFLLIRDKLFIMNSSHVRGKAWEFASMSMKVQQHKVNMLSMWFSFQQFGLCMPFPDSVKCSNIKTCKCHQNIPLKAPEDIMCHRVWKLLICKPFISLQRCSRVASIRWLKFWLWLGYMFVYITLWLWHMGYFSKIKLRNWTWTFPLPNCKSPCKEKHFSTFTVVYRLHGNFFMWYSLFLDNFRKFKSSLRF